MKKMHRLILCAFPLIVVAVLSGCAPTVANRGNILDPDNLTQITPGKTTREQVATALGSPTEVSTFDEKVWYYIGRQTEQYSFFRPDVIKQQAVEVDFDDQGVVVAVKNLDLKEAADVAPIDRETPTFGHDNTILRQLLGDLSHPMPNIKNSHEGQ
jgi:outer membrane protein assembly factor BamE (lipoprotein component of BamABCDE complex)